MGSLGGDEFADTTVHPVLMKAPLSRDLAKIPAPTVSGAGDTQEDKKAMRTAEDLSQPEGHPPGRTPQVPALVSKQACPQPAI